MQASTPPLIKGPTGRPSTHPGVVIPRADTEHWLDDVHVESSTDIPIPIQIQIQVQPKINVYDAPADINRTNLEFP